ncbi:hypothetical protein [Salipiger mucosus]|uniref:hypothetical protein n=1 Tax=Salipiger mucosus TaxID=263378 RepID=UPI001FDF6C2E|nr:hypothetical protein [Salipiger mucosus]
MSLLVGSFLGAVTGLVAWLAFDVSLLGAFAIYLGCALGLGLLPLVRLAFVDMDQIRDEGTPART